MSELIEQTAPSRGFVRGSSEQMKRLRNRPGAPERVAAIREEMREADRVQAMNVAAIRKAADLTQTELAGRLGVGQSVVSRTERGEDMLLSTLANYLAATGADAASIVVSVNGINVEFDLIAAARRRAETSKSGPAS